MLVTHNLLRAKEIKFLLDYGASLEFKNFQLYR